MPLKTNYSPAYMAELQIKLDAGDYKGFWTSLGQNGDTYADNAAVVTGSVPKNSYDQMMQDLVKVHWDNTAGAGMYDQHFKDFAIAHARQYYEILKTGDFPSTTEIVNSYDTARQKVNAAKGVNMPPEVIFDAAWGVMHKGAHFFDDVTPIPSVVPQWNELLGMEKVRDSGTPNLGINGLTALKTLKDDFAD